ncbi:DDE superfamily endonuclease [Hirsutella rhossiliensis]
MGVGFRRPFHSYEGWPIYSSHNAPLGRHATTHLYPEEIGKWFSLVRATIAKYGIAAEDIYNFDETGFQMGRRRQSTQQRFVVQPGDRNWVTVIEGVNVTGWALPSTIIFEGKVHQSTWYRTGIPPNWVIGVSENGWTNNELGFKWSTEVFDKHSRGRAPFYSEFDDFCKKNSIIWLFYPPHSTHLLQALDFGCFSALKNSYGRLVQEKVELGTFRIDKTDFLVLYHQAHRITFTEKTIKNAFEAVGIVPYNPQKVLSRLNVRTPSPLLQPTTLDPCHAPKVLDHGRWLGKARGWEASRSGSQRLAKTPHNITELEAQAKALQKQVAVRYLVKGCQMAMHGAALLSEENERLRSENQRQRRKRDMRRSYVAHGGVLAVEKGLRLAEERANGVEGKTGAQRLCSMCREERPMVESTRSPMGLNEEAGKLLLKDWNISVERLGTPEYVQIARA